MTEDLEKFTSPGTTRREFLGIVGGTLASFLAACGIREPVRAPNTPGPPSNQPDIKPERRLENGPTYKSLNGEFEIKLPQGWNINGPSKSQGGFAYDFSGPLYPHGERHRLNISVAPTKKDLNAYRDDQVAGPYGLEAGMAQNFKKGIKPELKPVKVNFHGVDAWEYSVKIPPYSNHEGDNADDQYMYNLLFVRNGYGWEIVSIGVPVSTPPTLALDIEKRMVGDNFRFL